MQRQYRVIIISFLMTYFKIISYQNVYMIRKRLEIKTIPMAKKKF